MSDLKVRPPKNRSNSKRLEPMPSLDAAHVLLALLLGLTAAGANVLGGLLIVRGQWSRHYLKYFIALGAGFMLATALLEMIPESVKLRGEAASLLL